MGLLDELAEDVLSKMSGGEGSQTQILEFVMGLINNPETGGLGGFVENFKSKGLGNVIGSWIGSGENQSISREQIQHVFGGEQIQQLGQKLGLSGEELSGSLASLLPQLIDKLTPDGTVPQGGLLEQELGLLKGKLFGGS